MFCFQWTFGARDGLIFLIDCSEAMFEFDGDESPFDLCIKVGALLLKLLGWIANVDFLAYDFIGGKIKNYSFVFNLIGGK